MDSNMSLSDIAAVTNGNSGFGNNSFIWLFAILALMWGGNGFFGNANQITDRAATVEDLANSANFTRLESQVQGIGNAENQNYISMMNDLHSFGTGVMQDFGSTKAKMAEQFGQTNSAIQAGIGQIQYDLATNFGNAKYDSLVQSSGLSKEIAAGSAENRQLLMENRYLNAQEVSGQTAQILAAVQSVKDQISEDKIANLQAQVNNLTMQNAINTATYGTVKYPNASTYNAGYGPFCNCQSNNI